MVTRADKPIMQLYGVTATYLRRAENSAALIGCRMPIKRIGVVRGRLLFDHRARSRLGSVKRFKIRCNRFANRSLVSEADSGPGCR